MVFSLAYFNFYMESEKIPLPWLLFSSKLYSAFCNVIVIKQKESVLLIESKLSCPIEVDDIKYLEDNLYHLCANVLLTKGVLHLHSSFVLYKDKALVFTGPSGIGKTTQAELWRDYQGALIVNGDACLLRRMEDGWHAFGTPVHGSSPYCENREAPLSALVVLKQGSENRLERLDAFSALSECLPEFYRPRMDPETEDTFWKAADSLFREIPVYKLTCRPDREATELVKETIFGA